MAWRVWCYVRELFIFPSYTFYILGGTSWHLSFHWCLGYSRLCFHVEVGCSQDWRKVSSRWEGPAGADRLLHENVFHLRGNSLKQHSASWLLCLVSVLRVSSCCHSSLLWELCLWQFGLVSQSSAEAHIKSTTFLPPEKAKGMRWPPSSGWKLFRVDWLPFSFKTTVMISLFFKCYFYF